MGDNDDVMGQALGLRLAESGGLLLGRRSYEDMLACLLRRRATFVVVRALLFVGGET